MSDLFDDLEFEVLGEDFEDPFESMAGGQNLPPPPEILAPQVQPASAVLQKEESILDAGADHAPETPPPAFSEIHAAEPEDTEEERPAAGSKGGTSSEPAGTAAVNMMAAMAEEAEAATAQQDSRTLMELPPVFKYGACEEDITDAEITFEQLRAEKEPDFLELEDSKRVTWAVQYGRVTKTISSPAKQKIAQVKEEIELSKEFWRVSRKQRTSGRAVLSSRLWRANPKGSPPTKRSCSPLKKRCSPPSPFACSRPVMAGCMRCGKTGWAFS